jgi:hypothetical protein
MKRRLGLEQLETRQLLAGNVTVQYIDFELKITGDNATNAIQVFAIPGNDGSGNTIRVVGRSFDGNFHPNGSPIYTGEATTINRAAGPFNFIVPSRKISITTRSGNDAVVFGRPQPLIETVASGLSINTGAGSDYLSVQNARDENLNPTVFKMTSASGSGADLENEADRVYIDGFHAQRSLRLTTGGGNDIVSMNNFGVTNGLTVINTGLGLDRLTLSQMNFDRLQVDTGGSSITNRENNSDRDVAIISKLYGNSAEVFLGGGNDTIEVEGEVEFAGSVTIDGGSGNDKLNGSASSIVSGLFTAISITVV